MRLGKGGNARSLTRRRPDRVGLVLVRVAWRAAPGKYLAKRHNVDALVAGQQRLKNRAHSRGLSKVEDARLSREGRKDKTAQERQRG